MAYKIAVVGTGYVGLVTGVCFAEIGNEVVCVDVDEEKVAKLQQGIVPIYEPGLDVLLERNLREQRIQFTTQLESVLPWAEIIMLCLPTPPDEDGSADLSYVLQVARQIGTFLKANQIRDHKIVVNKSTVPVGTAFKVRDTILGIYPEANVTVVSNPEFLREGFAVEDFMKPDRVVVGTSNPAAAEVMRQLYKPFTRSGNPIFVMDELSAEITKYAANAFLATKISFMNDIAAFCEKVGANVDLVRLALGADPRIGKRFLFPGLGYGGSCFPKDLKAILRSAAEVGVPLQIIEAAENVNQLQIERFVSKIFERFGENLHGRLFALWGLAFKPNTDDVREAPAFKVIDRLLAAGAQLRVYDPEAMENTRKRYQDRIEYGTTMYQTLDNADALIIATEWNEFRFPDFAEIRHRLKAPIIFDGRNVFDLDTMRQQQFEYYSVGRPPVVPVTNSRQFAANP